MITEVISSRTQIIAINW